VFPRALDKLQGVNIEQVLLGNDKIIFIIFNILKLKNGRVAPAGRTEYDYSARDLRKVFHQLLLDGKGHRGGPRYMRAHGKVFRQAVDGFVVFETRFVAEFILHKKEDEDAGCDSKRQPNHVNKRVVRLAAEVADGDL